jgi:hypothetical protein
MTISKDAGVISAYGTGTHFENDMSVSDGYLLHNNVVWCIENGSQHILLILL